MLQVNAIFACDLPSTWYRGQVLEASIPLATSDIPYTCNGDSFLAIVYLKCQFEFNRNNIHIITHGGLMKAHQNLRLMVKIIRKSPGN